MSVKPSNTNFLRIPTHKDVSKIKLSNIPKFNTNIQIPHQFNSFIAQNSPTPIYSDFLRAKDLALYKGDMPGEFEENSFNSSQNDEDSNILLCPQTPFLCSKINLHEVSEYILS
jgi:hypothetical protein